MGTDLGTSYLDMICRSASLSAIASAGTGAMARLMVRVAVGTGITAKRLSITDNSSGGVNGASAAMARAGC